MHGALRTAVPACVCRDEGVAELLDAASENVARLEVLEVRGCGAASAACAAAGGGLPMMRHLRHLDLSWSVLGGHDGDRAAATLSALGRGLAENSSLRTLDLCAANRHPRPPCPPLPAQFPPIHRVGRTLADLAASHRLPSMSSESGGCDCHEM